MISARNHVGDELRNEVAALPATTARIPRSEPASAVSHLTGMGSMQTSSGEFFRFGGTVGTVGTG
jgi:hypothetical protein